MMDDIKTIEVHTTCGKVFHERVDDMSDWQISGLIEQNPDNEATPTLRQVLARRQRHRAARGAA